MITRKEKIAPRIKSRFVNENVVWEIKELRGRRAKIEEDLLLEIIEIQEKM